MKVQSQPWIYSASVDGVFILAPALFITALVLCFRHEISAVDTLPVWLWGVLIVGVDVGHVYSTLFRTYADPEERKEHGNLFVLVPLGCWIIGTVIYSFSAIWFWRALAYLAIFHFVRQQYGFMMIYCRKEKGSSSFRRIDKFVIYMATLYPLIYWHTHWPRNFDWFVANDFLPIQWPVIGTLALIVYVSALAVYLAKEAYVSFKNRSINIPKNFLLLGTAISWFTGIVYFDNDLAFTATNVIAHGIPYIALIWIYGRNRGEQNPSVKLFEKLTFRRLFSIYMLPVYIGILVLFGYCEEGLWDGFIWTEHKNFFHLFQALPNLEDKTLVSWLIPLLALPQMTHYVLDAYIWRLHEPRTAWKQILFYRAKAA